MQGNHADSLAVGRALLAAGGPATLATLGPGGAPFASYVTAAGAPRQPPVLLLSGLAQHTRNLLRDARASLLLVGAPEDPRDPMTAPRLTLVGSAARHADQAAARELYLAAHPEAELYAGFSDFAYYAFTIESAHLVAGFGRIVGLAAEDLLGQP